MLESENDSMKGTEGTYYFMPPESFAKSDGKGVSGKKADLWALGVTFYAFAFLRLPFMGATMEEFLENIESQELKFPEERSNAGLNAFISKILVKNPNKRASVQELARDEWLNEGEQDLFSEMFLLDFLFSELKSQMKSLFLMRIFSMP